MTYLPYSSEDLEPANLPSTTDTMQAYHMIMLLGTALLASTDAGYYKRPLPPSKLHYLPKPPPHHYHKPPPPFYSRRPAPIHAPRNPIRPPPRPYISKPTPPPPPPFPPASWKTHSSFRAPVVKETFHSSPLAFTPEVTQHFLQDDDKGPIHTIPAPNLSPADRPANLAQESSHNSALDAVLNHAAEAVRSKPTTLGYQVTEDPSVYKPYSGAPSYFAPDPDPSLPTIEVPQTMDPHSVPSNGVTPLDLYQQQAADQQTQHQYEAQQYADGTISGSTLSPQDLYQLLQGAQQQQQQQQQQQMTPQLYQQYLQAASAQQPASAVYQQVFQAGLLYPHHFQQQQVAQFSQQNFHPQFETFNYNEQTQESAHGSDSFPSASSISVGVKRAVSKDTRISGESPHNNLIPSDYLDKTQDEESDEVGVISNQVDYEDEQSTEESAKETFPPNLSSGYYTTLPNKQAADTLATLAVAGSINNQMAKGPEKQENHENRIQYSISSMQAQREDERRKQKISDEEQQRAEEERRQEQQRANEIRNHEEHREQMYRNQEIRMQENQQNRQQVYLNHDMGDQENKQNHRNQDIRETERKNNRVKESSEQISTESDYNEDEILDTSDKDQRNINSHMQNSPMRPYDTSYYRQRIEKDKETQTEEQSYEDADSDYSQEEVKEINNTNKMTKPPSIPEKSVNYNAHQNQLPFGAKLRPKRV